MSDRKPRVRKCNHGIEWDMCDICKPAPSELPALPGSANSSNAKEALKKEIARIIDDAFTAGFDADNAGALDHFDGFALADAAIEKHWPNGESSHERSADAKR